MSDLTDLYQEVILDHNRRPRNFRALADATRVANGHNPLCGDKLRLYLRLDGDRIADISFEGSGCAISKASASLMTDAVKGRTIAEATELFEHVHAMVTTPMDRPVDETHVGKMAVLAGVREFPARVKCASLAWHTLIAALSGEFTTTHCEMRFRERFGDTVAVMHSALAPGGTIVLEDPDWGSWHFNPPAEGSQKLIALIHEAFARWGDAEAGRNHLELLRGCGIEGRFHVALGADCDRVAVDSCDRYLGKGFEERCPLSLFRQFVDRKNTECLRAVTFVV
jgi:nitrogen fixation NifU-like protein